MEKYAILVGVEDYTEGSGITPLQYARRDVMEIGRALEKACGFQVRILAGGNATPAPTGVAILEAIEEAAVRLGPDDIFFFFFAGHGIEKQHDQGGVRSYLLPADGHMRRYRSFLELDEIRTQIKKIDCQQRLFFLDCCRNDPQAGKGDADQLMSKSFARELVATAERQKATSNVTILMTACRSGQRAYEWPEVQHGLFSYYLKEGINGKAWSNGQLLAQSLCSYVEQSVIHWAEKTNHVQHPEFQQLESARPVVLGTQSFQKTNVAPPPPLSEMPPLQEWYYAIHDQRVGPLTMERLVHVFQESLLPASTVVWKQGLPSWSPVSSIEEVWSRISSLYPDAPPVPLEPEPPSRVEERVEKGNQEEAPSLHSVSPSLCDKAVDTSKLESLAKTRVDSVSKANDQLRQCCQLLNINPEWKDDFGKSFQLIPAGTYQVREAGAATAWCKLARPVWVSRDLWYADDILKLWRRVDPHQSMSIYRSWRRPQFLKKQDEGFEISAEDIRLLVNLLKEETGKRYRLPSELEWVVSMTSMDPAEYPDWHIQVGMEGNEWTGTPFMTGPLRFMMINDIAKGYSSLVIRSSNLSERVGAGSVRPQPVRGVRLAIEIDF